MAIGRITALMLGILLASNSFARVDLDSEAAVALEQLESAQAAYELALVQLATAETALANAKSHAIAIGALPLAAQVAVASAQASTQPETQTPEVPAVTPPAAKPVAPKPKPKPEPKPAPKEVEKKKPAVPSFWDNWKRSVRVGFNTSSGNTENTNLNLQFHTKRRSKKYLTKFDSEYRYATRNGVDSQNRLDLDFRHEWLAPEGSKVGWWTTASFEVDEFQNWDYRASAHAGISYQFIKNDKTHLKGRTGFGGSQTFGGTADDFRPEALVTGIDLRHRFNDTMNVEAGLEYFVDVSEVTRDRLNNNVKWNILLDKESNMNLQFKLSHRYDSEPGGNNDNNDINFDITVGWQF
ncbi:MAG: DUF481 domain-containing protein [Phycisphaerales bacterium]